MQSSVTAEHPKAQPTLQSTQVMDYQWVFKLTLSLLFAESKYRQSSEPVESNPHPQANLKRYKGFRSQWLIVFQNPYLWARSKIAVPIITVPVLVPNFVGSVRGLILRYYPGIRLEGLRKNTENLNQDSRSPGSDPGPPEYEAGVASLQFSFSCDEAWCAKEFMQEERWILFRRMHKFTNGSIRFYSYFYMHRILYAHLLLYYNILTKLRQQWVNSTSC
jgi:hypothetical protein